MAAFLVLGAQKLVPYWIAPENAAPLVVQDTSLQVKEAVVSRNLVNLRPFGVDSVFSSGRGQVYFTTQLPADSLEHRWYRGDELVYTAFCLSTQVLCSSSVRSPLPGYWSVDLVSREGRLFASRQFEVRAEGSRTP